jgi:hypothetical protein
LQAPGAACKAHHRPGKAGSAVSAGLDWVHARRQKHRGGYVQSRAGSVCGSRTLRSVLFQTLSRKLIMTLHRLLFTACLAGGPVLLAACASRPAAPPPPAVATARPAAPAAAPAAGTRASSSAVPAAIAASADLAPVTTVAASGVQIYECRPAKDRAGAFEWAFVAPEAELADAQGKPVGKHYAGPHWEAADGSRLVGTVKARADAPEKGAIPWLLLSTRSVGTPGRFAPVTYIQRINTEGGEAPPAGCSAAGDAGKRERVGYTADYVMFAPRY